MNSMHKELKWFARIFGLLVTVFFLAFFIGEGLPDIINRKGNELTIFLLFCIPAFIGYFIAWIKPYAGGILMILGALLIGSYFVYHGDFKMSIVFGMPALLIGLSFVASVNRELL